jgi:hypothetical protein
MALKEPILAGSAPVVTGQLYVVNGKPVVSTVTGTVATLAAAIGGSPTIAAIDYVGRRAVSPFGAGIDPFGT